MHSHGSGAWHARHGLGGAGGSTGGAGGMTGRDVIKDDFGEKLPPGRPFRPDVRGRRPDVRARPRLPRGRGFICRRVFTVRRRGKNCVRADAVEKFRKKYFILFYF
jgi:hypothetical protein